MGLFSGCGPGGAPQHNVAGTVTFDGQPVPRGSIRFLPDTEKGNTGPGGAAEITNGAFDTAKAGSGTVGGRHIVIIDGFDGNAQPENELPIGKPLFTEFRTNVDLPKQDATGQDFTVPKHND